MIVSTEIVKIIRKVLLTTLGILLIPLVLTLTLDHFNWNPSDFLVGGFLLFSFGMYLNYIWRLDKSQQLKIIGVLCGLLVLLLIWVALAVGFF